MTVPEVLALVAFVLIALAGGVLVAYAPRLRPIATRRRVIVVLRTGETLRGVLVARRPTFLELARVEVLTGAGGPSSTVDGTVQVDRDNVTWVQVP